MLKLASLDPRVKLALLAIISTASLLIKAPLTEALLLLLTIGCLLAGGLSPRELWRQARLLVKMIGLLFLIQCLFRRSGPPLLSIGEFTLLFRDGLDTALLVSLKLLIIVSSALIVLTGEVRDYLLALRWCGLPYELVYMVMAALRFIPLLREEAREVNAAFRMRGCDVAGAPWGRKAKLYVTMLLPITAGALHRAERSSLAMEARAFRSRPRRSQWRSLSFTRRDGLYLLGFCLVFTALLLCCHYFL